MRLPNFPRLSRMHWAVFCWTSLPLSDTGKNFLRGRTIYLGNLPTKLWQSTALGGPKNLIPKNCDLAHHGAVPEDVQRTARRGSASSPSCVSRFPAEPESSKSSFQACSPDTTDLLCTDQLRLSN